MVLHNPNKLQSWTFKVTYISWIKTNIENAWHFTARKLWLFVDWYVRNIFRQTWKLTLREINILYLGALVTSLIYLRLLTYVVLYERAVVITPRTCCVSWPQQQIKLDKLKWMRTWTLMSRAPHQFRAKRTAIYRTSGAGHPRGIAGCVSPRKRTTWTLRGCNLAIVGGRRNGWGSQPACFEPLARYFACRRSTRRACNGGWTRNRRAGITARWPARNVRQNTSLFSRTWGLLF